jgi:hypothetical protein
MTDITRNYHRGNRYSEAANAALERTRKKESDKMRIRALMIRVGPKRGVTCQEAEEMLMMPHETCSARFSDMKDDEELHHVGTRETRAGNKAGVWTLARLVKDA